MASGHSNEGEVRKGKSKRKQLKLVDRITEVLNFLVKKMRKKGQAL
jgi:hypothetical protein